MNSRCHSAALTIVNFISVATNAYGGNELNSTRCLSRSGCGSIADGMLKTRFELGLGRPPGRHLVNVPATTRAAYRTWQPQAEGDITVRWGSYIDSGSDRPLSGSIFWIPDGQCEFQIGDSDRPGQMA